METVLITGGSGMIGSRLSEMLNKKGYSVRHLVRHPQGNERFPSFAWSVRRNYIDPAALQDVDHVIHLAGSGIADQRWTESRKRVIVSSRVDTLHLLYQKLSEQSIRIKTLVSASGINYYGMRDPEHINREEDPAGKDFLSAVCVKWEQEALKFPPDTRVVMLRTATVLSKKGGALERLAKPVKLYAGAPLGSGRQWFPWIHIDDLCRMYIHALENPLAGPYNAVSSEHITNEGFTKKLAAILKKPLWLPNIPGWVMKLLFGELAVVLLYGNRAENQKIRSTGFVFKYPEVEPALKEALSSP
ncbi:MAG: TIGR01777 family oxidoreductase [Bacteroidota bacterium]